MVAETSGKSCEPVDSVSPVLQVELEFFDFLRGCAVFLFLFLLLLCGLLLFSVQKFGHLIILLVPEELRHGLSVEEHDIDVIFRAPAAVASVTVLVRLPDHGFPAECPSE